MKKSKVKKPKWVVIYMMDPSDEKRVLKKNLKKYLAQGWEVVRVMRKS